MQTEMLRTTNSMGPSQSDLTSIKYQRIKSLKSHNQAHKNRIPKTKGPPLNVFKCLISHRLPPKHAETQDNVHIKSYQKKAWAHVSINPRKYVTRNF